MSERKLAHVERITVLTPFIGFYLPSCRVKLKVNKLTSTKTLLPLDYYVLPFCAPKDGAKMDNENLGEFLVGDRIMSSPYYLEMKKDMYCEQLCVGNLGRAEMPNMAPNKMVKAIRKNYHNNWIVDNLPSASKVEDENDTTTRHWQGFPVGFVADDTKLAYIHNHVNIEIDYHPVENEANKYRVVGFTVEPFSIRHDFDPIKEGEDDIKDDHVLPAVAKIRNPIPSCAAKSTEHTSYDMVTASGRVAQEASGSVLFTYDVKWNENLNVKWASRCVYCNVNCFVSRLVVRRSSSVVKGDVLTRRIISVLVSLSNFITYHQMGCLFEHGL
jgi:transmembrane 9 superfamily protein 2/4